MGDGELQGFALHNLLDLSSHLSTLLDFNELVQCLPTRVVGAVPLIQSCLLWLYHPYQQVLQVESFHGAIFEEQRTLIQTLQLRPGEGLPGTVLKSQNAILIENSHSYREKSGNIHYRNERYVRAFLDQLPYDCSIALVPLRTKNKVLGVLEVVGLNAQVPLQQFDLQILQTFANLVAGALENAELHTRMQANQQRLEGFGAIGTAVSAAADLDELMDNVLDVMLGLVNTSAGMILLFNPALSTLNVGAYRNLPDTFRESYTYMLVSESSCEEAVRYGQPICRPLLTETHEQTLLDHHLESAVYLPLLAGGTVTGVVCLYGDESLYERVNVQSLMMMGSLVGFAIANVTLYYDSNNERRRLMTVINSIAEGVALCDGQGRLVLANETALSLLSLESIPMQQSLNEMPDFYSVRDLEGVPLPVEKFPLALALSGEVFYDYRILVHGASGQDTVMSFTGAPVYDTNRVPDGAVVVFRDVTTLQKVERAKDDFLAVAAHELRSPLAAVRSYADLLVKREKSRGEEHANELRGVTILAQQVTHMLHMVDSLLDVSRLDADLLRLDLQEVELVSLVHQVCQQQRHAANQHELHISCAHQELTVTCDQMRIRQVLTNLLSNAIRYSSSGTQIDIFLTYESVNQLITYHSEFLKSFDDGNFPIPESTMVLIAVRDQGVGMSEEQLSKLFKRYARGEERRTEGLGIGLYLSREFVVRHQGAIWAESVPGRGSTFFVAIPMYHPQPNGLDHSFA